MTILFPTIPKLDKDGNFNNKDLLNYFKNMQDVISKFESESLMEGEERFPIGSYYVQFPAEASNTDSVAFPESERPATLFGGTWEEKWTGEGVVFQTSEGTDHYTRTNGLMEDHSHGHHHNLAVFTAGGGWFATPATTAQYQTLATILGYATTMVNDGTNGDPRFGSRTAHRNRLMKVWKRIA